MTLEDRITQLEEEIELINNRINSIILTEKHRQQLTRLTADPDVSPSVLAERIENDEQLNKE